MNFESETPLPVADDRLLGLSIAQRFAEIASKFSDHPAVISQDQQMTYAELDAAANRVAQAVLDTGQGDLPVALLVGHDLTAVIGILGVLKAGCIYSVLAPDMPEKRIQNILDDLRPKLLLAGSRFKSLALSLAAEKIELSVLEEINEKYPAVDPGIIKPPGSPAAIYYTSGTTGQPKGVVRSQLTIMGRFWQDSHNFDVHPGKVISFLFPGSAGASADDLFLALLNGGALAIFDPVQQGVHGLSEWVRRRRIFRLKLPTAFMRQWLATLKPGEQFPDLSYFRPAGRLYREDVTLLWNHLSPEAHIFVVLASTETGMVTYHQMSHGEIPDGEVMPVGRPAPGVEVRLVGEDGEPVPKGEMGEIVVTSPFLAAGYWRRPELTAASFKKGPESSSTATFHMGDMGRWRADGLLQLTGRRDRRVKIRGFRVELDEVEMALEMVDGVETSAVTVFGEGESSVLVAYIVPAKSTRPLSSELRRHLRATLPPAAVPARFVFLEDPPLSSNQKLDRRALPVLSSTRPELDTPYSPPRTPFEAEVAAIWAEIFGFDEVGIHDDFLELGGHSLLAARIVNKVAEICQVEISMQLLFDSPTVAAMAQVVLDKQTEILPPDLLEQLLNDLETS